MQSRRTGFTLVEMMVAMTLTIFVMVILSQCFVAGLETFSGLKAIGDLQEELRTASTLIRSDLSQDHFEGKRRLSDPQGNLVHEKIREGFFAIGQGYPPNGSDAGATEGAEDGIISYRATDHWLHFTAKRRGNAREKFFSASIGLPSSPSPLATLTTNYFNQSGDGVFQDNNYTFHSAWAEIVYVLLPTGTTANPGAPGGPGTPLNALYRCQYVVLPYAVKATQTKISSFPEHNPPLAGDAYPYTNIAASGGSSTTFFSPNDLASGYASRTFNPYAYFKPAPTSNKNPPRGAALVLSNVVSFEVRILPAASSVSFADLSTTARTPHSLAQIPFDTANYVPVSPASNMPAAIYGPNMVPVPPPFSIQGLQIILRIWDPRSQQTRQVSIMQDM